jgi:hypothetical protein
MIALNQVDVQMGMVEGGWSGEGKCGKILIYTYAKFNRSTPLIESLSLRKEIQHE